MAAKVSLSAATASGWHRKRPITALYACSKPVVGACAADLASATARSARRKASSTIFLPKQNRYLL
jgi:hypothetical protein